MNETKRSMEQIFKNDVEVQRDHFREFALGREWKTIVHVEIGTGKVLEDNTNKHYWFAQYQDTLPGGYNDYHAATAKKNRSGVS